MKKKLIAILSMTLLFTAFGTAAYADDTTTTGDIPQDVLNQPASPDADPNQKDVIQGDIMLISAKVEVQPSYAKHSGTVTETRDGFIGTTISGKTDDMNDIINYTVTENTRVFDNSGNAKTIADVKKDSKITVFTEAFAPTPLILPPQYRADVIIIENGDKDMLPFVDVDTYINNGVRLTNAAGNLSLNLGKDTKIVDTKGNAVKEADLNKKDLVVFYTVTTRSIPAQTTPLKVVVLGENEAALTRLGQNVTTANNTDVTMVTINEKTTKNVYVSNNILMVPLRELAEANGMEVEWFGMNNAILLNGGKYSVTLNQNSYGVGRMMPQQLSCTPVLKNHLTYVPVDFFTDILGMTTSNDHGHLFLVNNDTF